jgi:natural product biosynthesis luciferase-like monooxygenase protein
MKMKTTVETQNDYWASQLAGLSSAVTLPADRERPPVSSFLRATVSATIEPGVYDKLHSRGRNGSSSVALVLLAALNAVLHRYTGSTDIVVGVGLETPNAPRARNLAPIRTHVSGDLKAKELVGQISATVEEAVANGECPGSPIREALSQESSQAGTPLFHIAFRFSNSRSGLSQSFSSYDDELANCDVVVRAFEDAANVNLECDYDSELFEMSTIERFVEHFTIVFSAMVADPSAPLSSLPFLTQNELNQLLLDWNDTKTDFPKDACIHQLFEAQAEHTPHAVAIAFEDQKLTYRQLNCRANQLAHRLLKCGAGPEKLVGISTERSADMVIGLLGILKSGSAYVPLDPKYPPERLSFMLQDAKLALLVTQERVLVDLPQHSATVVALDSRDVELDREPVENPSANCTADNLAYVIYTSGSTGKPKGVMISHRNVVNFFTGMDQAIGSGEPGTWLAVTSMCFDISVLELFWTLSRGFTVVVYNDALGTLNKAVQSRQVQKKKMDFSLLYFAGDEGKDIGNRYRLLLEGAKFADRHGFDAVWTPERHFHAFGGLYPNPSVTSAAVAAVTERIKIRAGSVVLPLQNPIRVAEEWSVVDNLSQGRVGISFASGWQINDFVLAPQNYAARKEIMLREMETVRKLWRGEAVSLQGADGKERSIKILPRPVQPDLPIWLTATGNPETYRTAGQLGANLLTHLVGQRIEDLAEKIGIYRKAWRDNGHSGDGHVTLMLHTFVGDDVESVRETVRQPFSNYLRTSVDLLKNSPWGFAPARLSSAGQVKKLSNASADLEEHELSALLEYAFDRYFENSSLFGTPDVCLRMAEQLRTIGVDEIACLIDFGVDSEAVLGSLRLLNEVRVRCNEGVSEYGRDYSLAGLARQHKVTHFQCTPSMATMLLSQPENHEWLGRLDKLMIGGEAFPRSLAQQLKRMVRGSIHNMYGPTETTVWSSTQAVGDVEGPVSIGRPIANTEIYIFDNYFQPVPPGVAGELCIGGAGVVRGYLNRPELTAEKFIQNPFSSNSGSRLYCTGDLARYRTDGTIEFLGRMDHQVKVRGYRIELVEIETVLGEHGSVSEAAVVVRADDPADQRIVAYVVLHPGASRDPKALRSFLQGKLPEYMVPATFVFLDHLPQTPNGKIDRRALPAPDRSPLKEPDRFLPPQRTIEKEIAGIWAGLLGVQQVSMDDNFFELGGHSLLATRLITKLRKVFQTDLPLSIIFDFPTVAGLAAQLTALIGQKAEAPPVRTAAQSADITVRPTSEAESEAVVNIHIDRFPESRVTLHGRPFLRKMYRWFMATFRYEKN